MENLLELKYLALKDRYKKKHHYRPSSSGYLNKIEMIVKTLEIESSEGESSLLHSLFYSFSYSYFRTH